MYPPVLRWSIAAFPHLIRGSHPVSPVPACFLSRRGDLWVRQAAEPEEDEGCTFHDGQLSCAGQDWTEMPRWVAERYGKKSRRVDLCYNELVSPSLVFLCCCLFLLLPPSYPTFL